MSKDSTYKDYTDSASSADFLDPNTHFINAQNIIRDFFYELSRFNFDKCKKMLDPNYHTNYLLDPRKSGASESSRDPQSLLDQN